MTEKKRNLYYLHELEDYKVADEYSDVRGWEVEDSDNRAIGKVENLLVDKRDKRVVYLDVEVNNSVIEEGYKTFKVPASEGVHGFLNYGEDNHIKDNHIEDNHIIIPIEMASLDVDRRKVKTSQINHQTFTSTRRFSKGTVIYPDYELIVLQNYLPNKKHNERSENDLRDKEEDYNSLSK